MYFDKLFTPCYQPVKLQYANFVLRLFKSTKEINMAKYNDWTDNEFRAYLFLYAADSNFEYNAEEKSFIESKFDTEILKNIKEQTDDLNDYQRSQIITEYIKISNYNQDELDDMLRQVKEVFQIDGKFDQYEKSIFKMLKKIMKV